MVHLDLILRVALGYLGVMLSALVVGVLQAIWLAYHDLPFGPANTVGGIVAMAMIAFLFPVIAGGFIWLAVRGFQ